MVAIADKEINRFNENEAYLDEASKHPVSLTNYKSSINSKKIMEKAFCARY